MQTAGQTQQGISPPLAAGSPRLSCLVLGVGNTLLQDDGVGVHIASGLKARGVESTQDALEILDGGTIGLALLPQVEAVDALVIVDAAELGEPPGTVRVFADGEIDEHLSGKRRSVHEVAILDLLSAAGIRGHRPRHCALVAVQPESTDWGVEPTPGVAAAIDVACDTIEALIETWRRDS
jgi:hydrogenase maturation protease